MTPLAKVLPTERSAISGLPADLATPEGVEGALRIVERQVVRLDDAVVVLADGYWPARKGLDALSPVWEEGANAANGSAAISNPSRSWSTS